MIVARKTAAGRSMVRLAMLATFVVMLLVFASPAWAETFTVTNTDDSGNGSLRQAITDANDTSEADTVTFASGGTGTITLANPLTVSETLTIEGPGAEALTISGNNLVRPLFANGTGLNISGVTIANGRASGPDHRDNYGGAVYASYSLVNIEDSVLRNNTASNNGGAIHNLAGTVNVTNSTLSENLAQGLHEGGGAISNQAFFVVRGRVNVVGSTLRGNNAYGGGAIRNTATCITNITGGSRLVDNGAVEGGAIFSEGSLTVENSTVSNNRASEIAGGGVYTEGGSLTVRRSTFSANQAEDSGGGIYAWGTPTMVHDSTFVGNVGGFAGAIEISSINLNDAGRENTSLAMSGSTVSDNTGNTSSGIYNGGGELTLQGSIVSGGNNSPDVGGHPYTNGGFNIIGGTAEAAGLQTDADGDPVLEDNGGPTKTVALAADSPAIDKGNSFGSATDQRGGPRPSDYGGVPDAQGGDGSDIGAFERRAPATAPDSYATDEGQTLLVDAPGVLANDTTGEGGAVTASRISGPDHGELALSPDGSFSYTPDSGYSGTDSFSYAASHGVSAGGPATVEITVRDTTAPDAPLIASPAEGARLTVRSFSVSGTAEEGAKVELFEGGVLKGKATAGPDGGAWSIALSGVSEGSHSYKAKAADAADNASAESEARTVVVDTVPPRVKRVFPAENATGVGPGANVLVAFSEVMRAASINTNTIKLFKAGTTTPLAAVVSYDASTKRAVLNPNANLLRGAKYKAVVTAGARDLAGNQLDQNPSIAGNQKKVWFFRVRN